MKEGMAICVPSSCKEREYEYDATDMIYHDIARSNMLCVYTCVHIHYRVFICVYIYIYMYIISLYMYMCVYIYIYTHMYITYAVLYTYTCICIHILAWYDKARHHSNYYNSH